MSAAKETAKEFCERILAEAKAAGFTTCVLAVNRFDGEHDHWWGNGFGSCLSMLALVHELREEAESGVTNRPKRHQD